MKAFNDKLTDQRTSVIRLGAARRFKRFFQCPLHFDNALSTSVFLLLPIFSLDSLKYSRVSWRLKDGLDPQCLCRCIWLRVTQDA